MTKTFESKEILSMAEVLLAPALEFQRLYLLHSGAASTLPPSVSKDGDPNLSTSPLNSSSNFWNSLLGQEAGEHFSCLQTLSPQLQLLPSESCSAGAPPITHLEKRSLSQYHLCWQVLATRMWYLCSVSWHGFSESLPLTCEALMSFFSPCYRNHLFPWKKHCFSLIVPSTYVRM